MRLAINIYRSKRWEMTKNEACWDGLGSWKSPEIRGSGLLERPIPTANAEGIQKRSSAGEPGYCQRAMEDSEAVSTLIEFISHKLGWFGLQWAGKSTGVQERRKKSGAWTSNLFRRVVKESELSGQSLARQPGKGRQRQRGASGKVSACSRCPAEQQGLWHWHSLAVPDRRNVCGYKSALDNSCSWRLQLPCAWTIHAHPLQRNSNQNGTRCLGNFQLLNECLRGCH